MACAEHTRAIRALLIDRLTPDQLDALIDMSETVVAALDDNFHECAPAGKANRKTRSVTANHSIA